MNAPHRRISPPAIATALAVIAARAADADAGQTTLAPDIALLRATGILALLEAACLPGGDTATALTLLRRLGRVSLPVGRLVEGHLNARRLVALYGTLGQNARLARPDPPFLGVWGADGTPPVTVSGSVPDDPHALWLRGRKRFCSGLGIVTLAVVPAADPAGQVQLVLADVSDPRRADPGAWQVSGMRATQSGTHDFDGMQAQRLGAPGDYLTEPHFEGGIWRYLALKTGALEGLAEAIRQHLRATPQTATATNRTRLMQAVTAAHSARMWTEAAAHRAEGPGGDARAIPLILTAREAVEGCALTALNLTDRVLGTTGFQQGSSVDLIRRDLGLYLRQADLDGKLDRAAGAVLASDHPVGDQW